MKFWALMFLLLSTQLAFSQEEDCEEDGSSKIVAAVMKQAKAEEAGGCPNQKKLMGMCMLIGSRTKDKQPLGPSDYLYYRRILEASCVDTKKDSEKTAQSKIQKMWSKFEAEMSCENTQFDVKGNYLKYAVATRFDEFLENTIEWKVNLNKVDNSDNRTVLDYVKFHMEKNKGNTIEKKMKYYYDLLREAGAKHKSEL